MIENATSRKSMHSFPCTDTQDRHVHVRIHVHASSVHRIFLTKLGQRWRVDASFVLDARKEKETGPLGLFNFIRLRAITYSNRAASFSRDISVRKSKRERERESVCVCVHILRNIFSRDFACVNDTSSSETRGARRL